MDGKVRLVIDLAHNQAECPCCHTKPDLDPVQDDLTTSDTLEVP